MKFAALLFAVVFSYTSCIAQDDTPEPTQVESASYIGVFVVTAQPKERDGVAGYAVFYDGSETWCDEAEFKRTWLKVADEDGNPVIDQSVVDSFVDSVDHQVVGNRTVIATAKTVTGFETSKVSSCAETYAFDVDPAKDSASRKANTSVWEYLGFVMQWAKNGVHQCDETCVDVPVDPAE